MRRMDSYPADRRYTAGRSNPYRSSQYRSGQYKRRTRTRHQGELGRLLAFQSLVSIILFLIIIIANSIDISAAGFIIRQVRHVISHDVEPGSIYTFARTTFSDIRNSIIQAADEEKRPTTVSEADDFVKKESGTLTVSIDGQTDQPDMTGNVDMAEQTDMADISADTDIYGISPDKEQTGGLYPETSVLAASSGAIDAYASGEPGAFGMISPVIGPVTTPFGEISGPGGIVRMHYGIDISVDYADEVKAVLDGIVTDLGSAPGYGNFIKLSHDNGLSTIYGNCSSIDARINDPVKKGNVIAAVGEDSMTGGSHLHFEVWNGNDPVDPLEYITVTAG
jgi:murein DD-endopeptidase MepM/ murein hydrolase activator NlpD